MDEAGNIRILVIDDEDSYRQALASGLSREGFVVDLAADGAEGLARFAAEPPDLVLLDMLLPDMHGIEVCRRLRQASDVPVVMVSAVDTELDVVLGLELGAAGYVTKPFRLRELVARVNAILRRVPTSEPDGPGTASPGPAAGAAGAAEDGDPQAPVTFGRVTVDFVRREVTVGGERVHCSRKEFDLLAALLTPPGRVRTRDELIDLLWPDRELADTRTLDTHVHRLRTKLEPEPTRPRHLVTVRGVGFRMDLEGAVRPPSRQPNRPRT
jgi:two-component system response regulator RegX3